VVASQQELGVRGQGLTIAKRSDRKSGARDQVAGRWLLVAGCWLLVAGLGRKAVGSIGSGLLGRVYWVGQVSLVRLPSRR
jgi:hypothetical protein